MFYISLFVINISATLWRPVCHNRSSRLALSAGSLHAGGHMDIFFTTDIPTYWWWDCYPTPSRKKLEQRGRKKNFQAETAVGCCCLLIPGAQYRPLSLRGVCCLMGFIWSFLWWVKSSLLTALDLNLALGSVFYSFLHHLGPCVRRHSTFLGHTAAIAVWFRKIFWKGEAPLAHQESETCLLLLADPRMHIGHNPGWFCIIRFHWIRS